MPQTCRGTGFIMMAEIQSAISQQKKHTKTGVYWQVTLDPPIRDEAQEEMRKQTLSIG